MSNVFDAIVLGLGSMGSATARHLAGRGQRVLGLDQFAPPHDRGSSHGRSRVIRQAYFEDPAYVPLLLRAYELWHALERDSGTSLLTLTGGLMLGAPDNTVVSGSLRSAQQHGLPHELLDAKEIRRRFPLFNPQRDTVALFEKNAGFVRPEESVRVHLELAAKSGAALRFNEEVLRWKPTAGSVQVETARGRYEAGRLVICAGPWVGRVLADLALPLRVERQVQFWFEPRGGIEPFLPDRFPIWIWGTAEAAHPYGLPATDGPEAGVKVSIHHGGRNASCTTETIEREVSAEEIEITRQIILARIPALEGRCLHATTCLYTNTPDEHFILDRHPQHPQVLIVSPCSGHGFKFSPVIGEIVADLIERGETGREIGLFGAKRLLR